MSGSEPRPIAVAHVITGLLVGGAETALTRLLGSLPRPGFRSLVVSLLPEGPMAEAMRATGAEVECLGMRPGIPTLGGVLRLRRALRRFDPDVIQGWMYHGNLAGWLGAWMLGRRPPVVWNIRQTLYPGQRERFGTAVTIRLGARLSAGVRSTLYNSALARDQHQALGYRGPSQVIPNGFDLAAFRPSPTDRAALREALGVPASRLIVGVVARFHPMKGHLTLLRAARRVLDAGVDASFVCAGRGVTPDNAALAQVIAAERLTGRVHLLGDHKDPSRLFPGFDVACMPSEWGEGFPNVVGEAMASGIPCVATDVGDAAAVIGTTGSIVPPRDADALGRGLVDALRLPADSRAALGAAARARIERHFSLAASTEQYVALYRSVNRGGLTSGGEASG